MPNSAQILFLLSFTTTLGGLIFASRYVFTWFDFYSQEEPITHPNPIMSALLSAPQLVALVVGGVASLAFAYYLRTSAGKWSFSCCHVHAF